MSTEHPPTDGSRRGLILGLALALLTLVAFLPAIENGFVNFDDDLYATDSPWTDYGLTRTGFVWAFSHYYASNYHPLTVLSHMLDSELFGLEPRGHHLVSVLLHVANAVLLFAILWRLTGSLALSAVAAALWAVHPLRVESVAWVAERKDVLSGFFAILTLGAYLRYVRRRSLGAYAAVVVSFSLGLLAKSMLVTLPFALLLLDVWPLGRLAGWCPRSLMRCAVEKLPLLALAVAAGVATILAQGEVMTVSEEAPLGLRAANAAVSYAAYLDKTVVPVELAVYYPFPAAIPAWKTIGAGLLLIGLSALALTTMRRAPYLAVGWFWFLGTLVPVIGLLKVGNQAMADRYTYLPAIGLSLAVTWGLHALWGKRFPKVMLGVAIAAVAILAALTRMQIGIWTDSETLFRHALAVTEHNAVAHLNLAEALRAAGDRREAEAHYRAALAVEPDLIEARAGLGHALRAWGDPQAALDHLRAAVELDRRDVRVHHSLAMTLSDLGRESEAIEHLRTILEIEPTYVEAHWGLGDLLARRGEVAAASGHFRAALALDPGLVELRMALAVLLARQGALDEAIAEFAVALGLEPGNPQAALALSRVLAAQGEAAVAEAVLRRGLEADPQAAPLRFFLEQLMQPGE